MARQPYDTVAGTVTPEILYARMMDSFERIQDDMALMAHLRNAEDTPQGSLIAKGWLALGEMMKLTRYQIQLMAEGRIKRDALEALARKLIH